jgi:regulator of replication initiation timing
MASSVSSQLNTIIGNTSRLLEICSALQEENDLLKLENQSIKVAFEASKNKTKELEEKVKALAVARSLEGSELILEAGGEAVVAGNGDIKRKINDFVKEIDRCIELLK